MQRITEKQIRFCREYIISGNATSAAVNAGYSKKSARNTGARLLKDETVQLAIAKIKESGGDEITKGYVVTKLMQLLERCLEPKPVFKWDSSTKSNIETGEYTFDSSGALKALEQLAKQLNTNGETNEEEVKAVNIIEDI